ncbi:MAG: LacI family DNA-binding transcriptional regulator [Eubacteriales bacterium]|nr:LacI family DNA-binding transcriptional regulator [Eubacteriales bacterium]
MRHPTIYDVSRLSGVSTATVSRTFSDPARVREGTRRRVYEAAAALDYQPSAIARAMARQRTDKLAFIICKKGATILDEFYAGICEGVMRCVNSMDYQLLVSTAEDRQREAQSKQIEGAILAGDAQPDLIAELQRQNVRVVLVNHVAPGFDLPCVVADDRDGVRQALVHLHARGHRRIAMLAGRFSSYITSERYDAFLATVKELGLTLGEGDILMCDRDVESATQAAAQLLSRPDRPHAVFAFNDVLAAGVIKAARRLGAALPDELAVVGFDDSSVCTLLEPELTSVHVDCRRMGELCMERMTALLRGEQDVPRLTVVPVSLHVRRSS